MPKLAYIMEQINPHLQIFVYSSLRVYIETMLDFFGQIWRLSSAYTIEDKNLGASAFYSITHSILKLFSYNLICMPIFDLQKNIPKKN